MHIRGKYHVEAVLSVGLFGGELFGDGCAWGDSWSTLEKQIDFGTTTRVVWEALTNFTASARVTFDISIPSHSLLLVIIGS